MTILEPLAPALPSDPSRPFWQDLGRRGAAPALVGEHDTLTYADLAMRVDDLAARLGSTRRLVLLEAGNDVDTVVGYLACLAGGHPVLLGEPGTAEALRAAYDPDVVLDGGLTEVRRGTRHDLHPDLAALLSTSGSTGSPKLVRLSARNVASNADAIATYLGIRPTDVAATTLPLHYCYGLSVLTSHLAAGASVLLTDHSVTDEALWDQIRAHRVTTFPGVPHTFDLLEAGGFAERDVPSLRYLTQAGGRLAPDAVRRFALLGQRRGFDLVVMYGATEATARMAYLPPDLAASRPEAIGVPIPGGSFRIDGSGGFEAHSVRTSTTVGVGSVVEEGAQRPSRNPGVVGGFEAHSVRTSTTVGVGSVGELIYAGENVMLGYAECPADLARGREVHELRTGDLARMAPDGLVEIVGRVSRFAKVFGLRLDLAHVEASLLDHGVVGYAADAGDRVVVAVDASAAPVDEARVRSALSGPDAAYEVLPLSSIPRRPNGKVDYAAIVAAAQRQAAPNPYGPAGRGVAEVYAAVLGRPAGEGDSFVSLGGDSLSYVRASLELERTLGRLPAGWHRLTVAELEQRRSRSPRRRLPALRTVETNVLLRALAIVAIVGSHSNLFMVMGGAHLLVGLAGYNFARFQLTDRARRERARSFAASTARIVVPSVLWLVFAAAASGKYDWRNVLLLNGVLGTREWSEAWHYWFVEALVWTLVALTLLLLVPVVDRWERRWSFWFPFGLALAALLTRYDVVRLFDGDYIHRAHVIFWLFALGWAAAKASTAWHRLLVSAVVVATVPGFFEHAQHAREAVIVVGMLLLIWVPLLRVPAALSRVAAVLASASLYVYLCHWQIYPAYEFRMPWLATTLSLSAGVAFWLVVVRVSPAVEGAVTRWFGVVRDNRRRLFYRRSPARDERIAPALGAAR